MYMGKYEYVGAIAGLLVSYSFTDLLLNVYKTNNISSLTHTWIIIGLIAQLFFIYYSIVNKVYSLLITSLYLLLIYIYFLYKKRKEIKESPQKHSNLSIVDPYQS
jgi:uncharacterized protein with PQ loop repeat